MSYLAILSPFLLIFLLLSIQHWVGAIIDLSIELSHFIIERIHIKTTDKTTDNK